MTTTNNHDTNIIMSLFVDGRAADSEVPSSLRRRGFWGDIILFANEPEISSGSKLWLVYGRLTDKQLNKGIDAVKKGLEWLVLKDYALQIDVDGNFIVNGINLNVNITVEDNFIKKFNFKLWENGIVSAEETL